MVQAGWDVLDILENQFLKAQEGMPNASINVDCNL